MKDDLAKKAINWFELDRLVDGQLSPQEYRELLRQVEKDPDGWRQCALAFLQHQAMEKELRAFSNSAESPLDRPAKPVATPPIYVRQLSRSMKVICGISMALILGITAGVTMRPTADPIDTRGGSEIASMHEGNVLPGDPNKNKKVIGFELSSAAPKPGTSFYSRSSSDYNERCEGLFDQDPHLGRCKRFQNQMDHND